MRGFDEGWTRNGAMNEDSEWWAAAVADMDAASVREWCLDRAASGALVDWCWWDGVQTTPGWDRARVAFVAFADMLESRQPTGGPRAGRPRWARPRLGWLWARS